MELEYQINSIEITKLYYRHKYTKKVINRIKNFIEYKDWNCLKGVVPIDKDKIPFVHSLVIDNEIEK